MRGSIVANPKNSMYIAVFIAAISICFLGTPSIAHATSSQVVSTICAAGSTITIDSPTSDSVTSVTDVPVSGTVSQSSQVQIEIDGQFDSIVPLAAAQTTYQTTLQLSSGTHTIKLTAIDTCGASNGSAQSVVTVSLPPSVPSNGSSVDTSIGTAWPTASGQVIPESTHPTALQPLIDTFDIALGWLNISPLDTADQHNSAPSLFRVFVITIGLYLLVIGLAHACLQVLMRWGIFTWVGVHDIRVARLLLRVFGLILILLALFL